MSGWASHILPSLESLGLWSYWIIGAAAMLESFFLTGSIVPGTLIVDAGGALVRLGQLDFFDLVWFVAVGAILGGEMGYRLGRYALRHFPAGWSATRSKTFLRAQRLFDRWGGMALVAGRFLGPVAGLVPLSAAIAGMPARRFRLWNIASAFPYALAHVTIGYAAGDLLARIGPLAGRAVIVIGAIAVVIGVFYLVAAQIRRGMPLVLRWLAAIRDSILSHPAVRRTTARHPGTAQFLARRFDADRFDGLVLTMLLSVGLYLVVAWADTAFDLLSIPQVAETDLRLANLIHAFWTPELLRAFGLITQAGHWPVVLVVFVGAAAALAITRRWPSLLQLCVALGGELITVRLLKGAFARPRPELGYFVETSGSFPSGHATLSVAFWGTLVVILWRERLIGVTTALFAATTLAVLIGGSRLYLIEHFLSDVVNGWIVGALWLVIGFGMGEWLRHARPTRPRDTGWRGPVVALLLLLTAGGATWGMVTASPPLAVRSTKVTPPPISPEQDFGTALFPVVAKSLTGTRTVPVRVVLRMADENSVVAALTAAGWVQLDKPTIGEALRAAWADLRRLAGPTSPAIPIFWNGRPQAMTFREPNDGTTLRLWRAGPESGTGEILFPVTAEPGTTGDAASGAAERLLAGLKEASTVSVAGAPTEGTGPDDRRWTWDGSVTIGTLTP